MKDADVWTHAFTLDATTPRAAFRLELDEATANLFTDCAVNVLDDTGRALVQGSFDGRVAEVEARLPDGAAEAAFTLQVVGAFALAEDMADWGFALEERYLLATPARGEVARAGGGPLRLYCGVPAELEIVFSAAWPVAPEGLGHGGSVRFLDQAVTDRLPGDRAGRLVLEVPIELEE